MAWAVRVLFVILAVLLIVPGWTGKERLALFGPHVRVTAIRVALDPDRPARQQVGALTFLGGVQLKSADPAFGGYSALAVDGDRFTLLSDGGNILRFRLGGDWRVRDVATADIPAGPGTGWDKRDRDTESMVVAAGHAWAGYEADNGIWRFDARLRRVQAVVHPRAMDSWPDNGGPEAMARLPDGRFVVIGEVAHVPRRLWPRSEEARLGTRDALLFAGDPIVSGAPRRFAYVAHGRHDVSDAAALPDGSLLVLERRFRLPNRWSAMITRVAARDIRAGGIARSQVLAVLEAPLVHDNFEGLAVTRDGAQTILWLVSDDNQSIWQRTLLLKFRLDAETPQARRSD